MQHLDIKNLVREKPGSVNNTFAKIRHPKRARLHRLWLRMQPPFDLSLRRQALFV